MSTPHLGEFFTTLLSCAIEPVIAEIQPRYVERSDGSHISRLVILIENG
jgi:hypothetical protein